MYKTAHWGREHVKSQENSGGYFRSGDNLKKLENLSSRRKVHMYANYRISPQITANHHKSTFVKVCILRTIITRHVLTGQTYPPQRQLLGHGQQLCEVSSPSKLPVKGNGMETICCHE